MHPLDIFEWMTAIGILLLIVATSFLFRGKWRRAMRVLAVAYVITYGVFYLVRPYWMNHQIDRDIVALESYLESRYPAETVTIESIPYGTDGFESMNPYTLFVTFSTEPDAEYTYIVEDGTHIRQRSHSSIQENKFDFLHLED
ncbi:hypothetical protein [Exiguobacterium sp. s16]|uniref:hypothetical protein n=1 Tax=Exiguobacterium sp. s16 TaxID=2751237 RepID=UPI001BE715AE|nr:hypothetical protein [Exiguobacterium sp. s16]